MDEQENKFKVGDLVRANAGAQVRFKNRRGVPGYEIIVQGATATVTRIQGLDVEITTPDGAGTNYGYWWLELARKRNKDR